MGDVSDLPTLLLTVTLVARFRVQGELMRNYKRWEIVALARALAVEVYKLLPQYPLDERFALCQQLRRAATSVGANIAEGGGRETNRDIAHFLSQAIGSICEVEFLMHLSQDLGFVDSGQRASIDSRLDSLKFKVYRLRQSLLSDEQLARSPATRD